MVSRNALSRIPVEIFDDYNNIMSVDVRLTVWKRDKSTGDDDGRRNEARGGLMSPKIRSSGRRYDILCIS